MRTWFRLQGILVAALVATGCGGGGSSGVDAGRASDSGGAADSDGAGGSGGSGGACTANKPCGGTILPGTFTISSFCAIVPTVTYTALCQNATLSTDSVDAQGTFSFSSDGSYSTSITLTKHLRLAVPASCKTEPRFPQSCADLASEVKDLYRDKSSPAPTVDCTGDSDCSCTIVATDSTDATGTWTTSKEMLLLTPAGRSSANPVPYCVSGKQLTLSLNLTGGSEEDLRLTRP